MGIIMGIYNYNIITFIQNGRICLICQSTITIPKTVKVERHFNQKSQLILQWQKMYIVHYVVWSKICGYATYININCKNPQ